MLDQVVQGNTDQMANPACVKVLKSWVRFYGVEAVRTGDGLYSAASGNPSISAWISDMAFRWAITAAVGSLFGAVV